MGVRVTGLKEQRRLLREARQRCVPDTKKVVGKGCNNVKKEARRLISGYAHLPHYPKSIAYVVTSRGNVVSGHVEPRIGRLQAGLGDYLEYGTVHNAPLPHMTPAADAEEPRFYKAMEDLAVKLFEGQPVDGGPVQDPG